MATPKKTTKPAPASSTAVAAPPAPAPAPQAPAPGQPAAMPQAGVPPMGMPGFPQGQNPMMAMMQMMSSMSSMMGGMGMGMMPGVDPSAVPFASATAAPAAPDADKGLDEGIIRPALITDRVKTQQAVPTGSVLDLLCLTEDGKHALGGLPRGCTMALTGPPGKGKTRTLLAALSKIALSGEKVVLVVAEEGFHDAKPGRDDLCSRFVKIGTKVTGLDEPAFAKKVLENVYVLECQYHKGTTWDDFVAKYRLLVEREKIAFAGIDSLNMLDPSKARTADNLSALKTYNHEAGVTCLCLGQVRDTGDPVGGEALQHTADAVFNLEEFGLSSKEIAERWGGNYRDKIDLLHARKSVTTPKFEHPVRVTRDANGVLVVHEAQPDEYRPLEPAAK